MLDALARLFLSFLNLLPTPQPTVLCALQDDRVRESSGLAVLDGRLWTHNDSGDRARLFALDRSCRTTAVRELGVPVVDAEDLAVADGALWLADTGDNKAVRSSVQVLRVDQRVTPLRFTYPDGPHDAEALVVADRVYLVTKAVLGSAGVYAGPLTGGALTKVASLPERLVTGAAYSGRELVLRTYTRAYVFPVTGGDVVGALSAVPEVVDLPPSEQGEAIAFDTDGRSWLLTSEGRGAPLTRVAR